MQAASLPATAGWQWARNGLELFLRQPLAMFTWAMAISMTLMLASLTPPIGPLLFVTAMPVITVMTLSACRHIEAGRVMLPSMWLQPVKKAGMAKRLFGLGAIYAGLSLLAGLVAFVPFMDALADAFQQAGADDLTPILLALRMPLLIFGVLYVIVAALFWYAPALVAWHGTRWSQALFFSGVACWRNKWAFAMYGLVWAAVFLAIDFCSNMLVAAGLSPQLVGVLQVPFNIAAGSILYCSFYPSYTSVFGTGAPALQFDH